MSDEASTGIGVSIIVPMYRVENYLPKCLESLVNQTLESKEIILVDDGSPDASGRIADEWAARHPEIRVIHQDNAGCAAARSRGLAETQGSYIGFVDSDDWVDAPMFEQLYTAAVTNNAEVAQCGFREVHMGEGVSIPRIEEFRGLGTDSKGSVMVDVKDLMTLQPTIWRRIYKRDFLRHYEIDFHRHIPRFDDLPFQFEVFMHTSRMVCIPEIYYNYRLGRVGQDAALDDERLFVHFDLLSVLREKVAEHADVRIERELVRVEIKTHYGGLLRIKRNLKWDYAICASRDIFGRRLLLERWAIICDAWNMSWKKGLAAILGALLDAVLPARLIKRADRRNR
jgi:glycosyltransferase involved in cell wall biosynthesis